MLLRTARLIQIGKGRYIEMDSKKAFKPNVYLICTAILLLFLAACSNNGKDLSSDKPTTIYDLPCTLVLDGEFVTMSCEELTESKAQEFVNTLELIGTVSLSVDMSEMPDKSVELSSNFLKEGTQIYQGESSLIAVYNLGADDFWGAVMTPFVSSK